MISLACVVLALLSEASAWSTFTVPHTNGADDVPGLMAAIGNYTSNASILFKEGVTYNIWTPIKFPTLTNVEVRIEGNLTYPTDIPTIQSESYHTLY